jgi:NAD(P)-dependent dehydrogenase (short-subunit alcohol dehydrogenase family)
MTLINTITNLRNKSALITGACGHIGRVISEVLAELGANLIVVDVDDRLFDLGSSITQRWGVKVDCIACNLEYEDDRNRLINDLLTAGNDLSILVNNAAFVGTSDLSGWATKFESQSLETWRRAIEVNLTAGFHLCQGLYPLMKVVGNASVINISSIYGHLGPDWSLYEGTEMSNPAAYAASKGGLLQLTRWLSTVMAPEVRVNAISPGGIERGQPNSFRKRYAAKTPLKRMGTEQDIQGAIIYLSTDMSRYVTGQNIMVDGGWGVW